MDELKSGDVVQLKSGGPEMTVDHIANIEGKILYYCKWFVGEELKRGSFSVEALKKIDK